MDYIFCILKYKSKQKEGQGKLIFHKCKLSDDDIFLCSQDSINVKIKRKLCGKEIFSFVLVNVIKSRKSCPSVLNDETR